MNDMGSFMGLMWCAFAIYYGLRRIADAIRETMYEEHEE